MATTDKYDFEEVSYGTQGWNGILTTNFERVDARLHTYIQITLGESVSAKDAVYLDRSSGKWMKAKADGTRQPCRCFAIEAGVLNDEIRAKRIGPMVKSKLQVGYNLYLSPTIAGGVTSDKPASNTQIVGWASGADEMFIDIQDYEEIGHATSTTTTTTTTTTVTSTTTTTV
jgi:hypothetical protein